MANVKNPSIIFMGTPDFAVPALEAINERFGLKAAVVPPDKPKGRGKKISPCEVKIKALELGIPVLQPANLKDPAFLEELKRLNPDIIATLAFRILPEEVFSLPKIATFNVHASLLPKYRGPAPINWAIIEGEKITGVTSFVIEKGIDAGKIILAKPFEIPPDFTAGDLWEALKPLAAQVAVETCELLLSGDFELVEQDDSLATKAPKVFPETAKIDWSENAEKVKNFALGHSPKPGAWTIWNGERLKILRAKTLPEKGGEPGKYEIDGKSFRAQCGEGSIAILELQLPGKKPMAVKDFLNGYRGKSSGFFE